MDDTEEPEVLALVTRVAYRLQSRQSEISDAMSALLARDVEGLDDDPQLVELLYASVEGNVSTIFHVLGNNIPIDHLHPTTAAVEYALRLAQRGIPGNSLRRAYHVGQDDLMASCYAEVQALKCAPELKIRVLHRLSQIVNQYIDWITQYVLQAYDDERQRWISAGGNVRSSLIHKLITREPVSARVFEAETGYALGQFHVGAVVWSMREDPEGAELMRIEQFVHDLAKRCGSTATPILTAVDRATAWAWLPMGTRPDTLDMATVRAFAARADHCRVALGLPAHGPAGFKRTHDQAQAAASLALAMPGRPLPAVGYGDQGVAITSVLARDIDATRKWVREVLGPLADNTEGNARLRETLHTFLGTGGSYTESAELLSLHRNSVKYRVDKAAEMRSRPIEDDRLDVELALQVCHFLGETVVGD